MTPASEPSSASSPSAPSSPLTGVLSGAFSGLPALLIQTPFSHAAVSLFGAQVLSFAPNNEADWLWLSPRCEPLPKPIRGGIPICWPWFAKEGQAPDQVQHGFARTAQWRITEQRIDPRGSIRIGLSPIETLHASLSVSLTMTVSEVLHLQMHTRNHSDQTVAVTQAFHSYLAVADANQMSIDGLGGCTYFDKLANFERREQGLGMLTQAPPYDRIYHDGRGQYELLDRVTGKLRFMTSTGSNTVVLWNPGTDLAAVMKDVGADQSHRFVCLEVANARDDVVHLAPGQSHTLGMTLA